MPILSITHWMNSQFAVFAAAPVRGLKISPQYYYVGLAILIVVLLLALAKAFREWQEIHDVEEPDSPADLLESFKEAHAAGELDDEEFERVRQRLSGKAAGADAPSPDPDDQGPVNP